MSEGKVRTAPDATTPFSGGSLDIDARRRVLLIGARHTLPEPLLSMEVVAVDVASFDAVTSELLHSSAPEVVLAPLFSTEFDITDLADRLVSLGYSGALHAYSRPLPAPRMVIDELRRDWPQLSFDLIELPKG